jgi:ribonuclease HI
MVLDRGLNSMVGLGFSLYLSDSHVFQFKAKYGRGSNNVGELNSLFFLLKFSLQNHVTSIQIMGDSLLSIHWMKGFVQIVSNSLQPLAFELKTLATFFQQVNFEHIYREWNMEANLSKVGLVLEENTFILEEYNNGSLMNIKIDVLVVF